MKKCLIFLGLMIVVSACARQEVQLEGQASRGKIIRAWEDYARTRILIEADLPFPGDRYEIGVIYPGASFTFDQRRVESVSTSGGKVYYTIRLMGNENRIVQWYRQGKQYVIDIIRQ